MFRFNSTLFAFVLFMIYIPPVSAQNKTLTPELLWKIGRVGLDAVSTDGLYAVYGVQRFDVAANKGSRALFIVQTETGETRSLTDGSYTDGDAAFNPNGKRVGFLRDGILYEVGIQGSDDPVKISGLEMNGFKYSPDGKRILFTQDVKLDAKPADTYSDLPKTSGRISEGLMYRHWKSWHDYAYSHVFYVSFDGTTFTSEPTDIMGKERFDSPLTPMGGMEQIQWSPDGRKIAYTCRKLNGTAEAKSTNSDIFLYDIASQATKNCSEGMPGYDIEPNFSPDGRYLSWTSMERAGFEADRTRLLVMDLSTNKRTDLTEGWKWECNQPLWSSDSRSLFFLSSTDFTYQVYQIGFLDKKIRKITEGRHDYQSFQIGKNSLIATRVSMDAPAEVYAVDMEKGTARALSNATKDPWDNIQKGKVERRTVRTTDGKDMNVWVVLPPNFDPAKKHPALLLCQGGPQSAVSQSFSFRWNVQLMAANGYVVVAPCRRGMPGGPEGQSWNDAISGDWGGQPMKDLLSAIDDVSKEPWIDAQRLGAVGASFGGYSVYWLAGNHNNRFKAFISHCGMFNTTSWWGTTEELWFAQYDLGKDYWSAPNNPAWTSFSPHLYVKNWNTPMLVIHNELDFRVPFSEGMQAFQAAQMMGVPSKMLSFPDEGHWMSKPQNSILWQREFFGWLDKWLK